MDGAREFLDRVLSEVEPLDENDGFEGLTVSFGEIDLDLLDLDALDAGGLLRFVLILILRRLILIGGRTWSWSGALSIGSGTRAGSRHCLTGGSTGTGEEGGDAGDDKADDDDNDEDKEDDPEVFQATTQVDLGEGAALHRVPIADARFAVERAFCAGMFGLAFMLCFSTGDFFLIGLYRCLSWNRVEDSFYSEDFTPDAEFVTTGDWSGLGDSGSVEEGAVSTAQIFNHGEALNPDKSGVLAADSGVVGERDCASRLSANGDLIGQIERSAGLGTRNANDSQRHLMR